MLVEGLLKMIFGLLGIILDVIPDMSGIDPLAGFEIDFSAFIDCLAYGFLFFRYELFVVIIGNVMFWQVTQMIWAIVEWVYKKIPGVS